ncbi:MAG: hypothetical protein WAZ94_12130 [Phycisphaerales bacterium]
MRTGKPKLRAGVLTGVLASVLVMGPVSLPLGGCYKRVVSSRGLGATGSRAQESYRSDTALDRWYDRTFTSGETKTTTRWVNPGATTDVRQGGVESYPRLGPTLQPR